MLVSVGLLITLGCRPKPNSIVGTWYGKNGLTVTFGADGSFSQTGEKAFSGKWKPENKNFVVSIDMIDNKPIDDGVRSVRDAKKSKSTQADIAGIKKVLSHIVYIVSEDGQTITQNLPGVLSTTYSRQKPK